MRDRHPSPFAALIGLAAALASLLVASSPDGADVVATPAQESPAQDVPALEVQGPLDWPREFSTDDGWRMVAHQPQFDAWEDFQRIEGRMAIELYAPGSETAIIGALRVAAATETNLDTHIVVVHDFEVLEARFPSRTQEDADRALVRIRELVPATSRVLSLDHVLGSLRSARIGARVVRVNPEPPKIFFSQRPSILVMFDGEPVMRRWDDDTDLFFALNTNWAVLQSGDFYYLLNEGVWLRAPGAAGPWNATDDLPDELRKLPDDESWHEVVAALDAKVPDDYEVPQVFVSQQPAEMIVVFGEPDLEAIPGTDLFLVNNTDADLLRVGESGAWLYLVSGRWFEAEELQGPWRVPTDLPDSLADIPTDHAAARVLASVPGTPEAEEALIMASIPQKAVVKRSEAKAEVTYGGDAPQFKPIEGTELEYAVNTDSAVIQVNGRYWLCQDGIWFVADVPEGPWAVADTVPDEIYAMPSDAPLYDTTAVQVYDSDEETVTTGYTGEYTGSYAAATTVGVTLMFGTGWYYPPYVWYPYPYYPYYWGYPHSYGVGAWYNPATGGYGRAAWGYGPYGGWGSFASYNPRTGTYGRGGAVWGPYQAAGRGAAYNPRTGTGMATRQYANPYERWGQTVVTRGDQWAYGRSYANDDVAAGRITTSGGNSLTSVRTDEGRTTIARGNDTYVGHDGEVYKRGDSGWQKYENGGWNDMETPNRDQAAQGMQDRAQAGQAGSRDRATSTDRSFDSGSRLSQSDLQRSLDADSRARMQSQQRSQQYRSMQSRGGYSRPRGGGGFRRR